LLTVAAGCLIAVAVDGAAVAAPRRLRGERYFIDFRARPSQYIGHTYVVYFRVDAAGRVVEKHHAGLIPEEHVWKGLVSPIQASIRKYKDDTSLLPSVIYRRQLTAAEFHRAVHVVHFLRGRQHRWHVVFFNCNDFGIETVEALGLTRRPSLLPPSVCVTLPEKMNGSGR
jgi:hypothetical protein